MGRYDDILSQNRPESPNHPPMPRPERAKQFMPFATLRGYGDAIADKEILSDRRAEGDDEADAQLDEAMKAIQQALDSGQKPPVTLEVYETDQSLRLRVVKFTGTAERVSRPERTLRVSGRTFSLDDLRSVALSDAEGRG